MTSPDDKPVCIDLFCKAGGASMGYFAAGFRVIGVDIQDQSRYPFEFVKGDALTMLPELVERYRPTVVAASPPCKRHTSLKHFSAPHHLDLIAPTREALKATGLPYVIENVAGAPLEDPLWLCGTQFGLRAGDRWLKRHRGFESNIPLTAPGPCECRGKSIGGVYGAGGRGQMTRGYKYPIPEARIAMGINWMAGAELSEAIPPAYTKWIGLQLMEHVQSADRLTPIDM